MFSFSSNNKIVHNGCWGLATFDVTLWLTLPVPWSILMHHGISKFSKCCTVSKYLFKITNVVGNDVEYLCDFAAITVPTDGLAPIGAMGSACWVMTNQNYVYIYIYMGVRTLHNRKYHSDMLYKTTKSHMTDHYTLSVSGPDESSKCRSLLRIWDKGITFNHVDDTEDCCSKIFGWYITDEDGIDVTNDTS